MKEGLRLLFTAFSLLLSFNCGAQLRKGEAAVEFRIRNDEYVAIVNRAEWRTEQIVRLCHRDSLSGMPVNASLYKDVNAKRAYRLIFSPIENMLKQGDNIYFSPTGILHECNLAALMDDSGKRLCEKYHFFRLSDIRAFPEDSRKSKSMKAILFGGMDYSASYYAINNHCWYCHTSDLQHLVEDYSPADVCNIDLGTAEDGTRAGISNLNDSKKEIKYIYGMNKYFSSVYSGAKASEELFKLSSRQTSDYIIHISTHSFCSNIPYSDEDSYMAFHSKVLRNYGLLFSGATRALRGEFPYIAHTPDGESLHNPLNDGLLYGTEIARLDMSHCNMVVLAACNTASGVIIQDGIYGLQTAFKEAGVRTMLMTLWSVNDRATAEFMKRFYTYYLSGKTKHESLELARKDLMQSEDYNEPLYWAPFIMLD